ncbi:MAG: hypothetical protein IKR57_04065 [Bacilli bacterium]|nr:hypothetical protein [Bacilli bacterium]
MKKFFPLLIMFSFILSIKAYENDTFKIDIPESYKETINENNVYKWENDNNYIAITVSDNKELKYNVKSYTDEDIIKQKNSIEENINKGLEQYEIKATVQDVNKNNIGELYYIEYNIYYPTKVSTGHDIYQRGRMYTTNNYITTIIYNSDKEIKDDNFNKILNTLTIKDDYFVTKRIKSKQIITSSIIVGILLAISVSLIEYKRRM